MGQQTSVVTQARDEERDEKGDAILKQLKAIEDLFEKQSKLVSLLKESQECNEKLIDAQRERIRLLEDALRLIMEECKDARAMLKS